MCVSRAQTCVVRAWDFTQPLLVAPAMNTCMWDSPLTQRHLDVVKELGARIVPPVTKRLACGDVGKCGYAMCRVGGYGCEMTEMSG